MQACIEGGEGERKKPLGRMLLFSSSLNMMDDFVFFRLSRRTPRRKLVFSSSDDETDNSPQSISSGKNAPTGDGPLHLSSLTSLSSLVHILRQEHQDEQ